MVSARQSVVASKVKIPVNRLPPACYSIMLGNVAALQWGRSMTKLGMTTGQKPWCFCRRVRGVSEGFGEAKRTPFLYEMSRAVRNETETGLRQPVSANRSPPTGLHQRLHQPVDSRHPSRVAHKSRIGENSRLFQYSFPP
jgi:hypothetical protein